MRERDIYNIIQLLILEIHSIGNFITADKKYVTIQRNCCNPGQVAFQPPWGAFGSYWGIFSTRVVNFRQNVSRILLKFGWFSSRRDFGNDCNMMIIIIIMLMMLMMMLMMLMMQMMMLQCEAIVGGGASSGGRGGQGGESGHGGERSGMTMMTN